MKYHFLFIFQVDDRCASGQIRLASTRTCVNRAGFTCDDVCSSGFEIDYELGRCQCKVPSSVAECNVTCQQQLPVYRVVQNADGQFELKASRIIFLPFSFTCFFFLLNETKRFIDKQRREERICLSQGSSLFGNRRNFSNAI